jgi:putative Mg2+ transporter-C (MgtC) family protein
MESLTLNQIAARVGAALLMGALIGLERERKHRPAGFRTMILVSIGSAAFMLTAREFFAQQPSEQVGADMSRVLQGLIGGIGFLGAGAVIQSKRAVHGMTTAAAVWVMAALGAACGLGLYLIAAVVVIATLFTLVILEVVEERFFPEENGRANDWDDKGDGPKANRADEPVGGDGGGPVRLRHGNRGDQRR